MSTTPTSQNDPKASGVLSPNPRLPLLITALGISLWLVPFHPWPSVVVGSVGLLLLVQTLILRLEITPQAMVIWQSGRELRRFPFTSWLAWRMFLPGLPGLLYFREEKSPHLLPILFDSATLKNQLRLRVGALEQPQQRDPAAN